MPQTLFACPDAVVNDISTHISNHLSLLVSQASNLTIDAHSAEAKVAELSAEFARLALGGALSEMCRQHTLADMDARGLTPEQVSLRNEPGYWRSLTTVFGVVSVFTFAYRFRSISGVRVTCNPAIEKVLPLCKTTRSSRKTLEWACRLASLHPQRGAQQEVAFFSGGELSLEDTTIARHAGIIGKSLDRRYLYKEPQELRRLLAERATRDSETGLPLYYLSSDAHYIRRYVDATWTSKWKSVNGVRLWCVDRFTNEIIHLGGEFTWGDCEEVVAIFEDLMKRDILPSKELATADRWAQLVVVTDGALWLVDRLHELFPGAVWILDAYHAYEDMAKHANLLFGKGSISAKGLYRTMMEHITGKTPTKRRDRPKLRSKPHRKRKTTNKIKRQSSTHSRKPTATGGDSARADNRAKRPSQKLERRRKKKMAVHADLVMQGHGIDLLVEFMGTYIVDQEHAESHAKYVKRLRDNAWRMDYPALRARGIQIGSGAMESIHRNGSQQRLKLPGARWTQDTAQALLHLRMMRIAGRWDDFWSQDKVDDVLLRAFRPAEEQDQVAA